MSRGRLWLLIAVAVVAAAFISGLVRGLTDTVPVQFEGTSTRSSQT